MCFPESNPRRERAPLDAMAIPQPTPGSAWAGTPKPEKPVAELLAMFGFAPEAYKAAQLHPDQLLHRAIADVAKVLYAAFSWRESQSKILVTDEVGVPSLGTMHRTDLVQPPVLWAMASRRHLVWVVIFGLNLCKEYRRRYVVTHPYALIIERASYAVADARPSDPNDSLGKMPDVAISPGQWIDLLSHPVRGLRSEEIAAALKAIARDAPPQGCAFGVLCSSITLYPELVVRGPSTEPGLLGHIHYTRSYALYLAWLNMCQKPLCWGHIGHRMEDVPEELVVGLHDFRDRYDAIHSALGERAVVNNTHLCNIWAGADGADGADGPEPTEH
jgi:hypothetical protein